MNKFWVLVSPDGERYLICIAARRREMLNEDYSGSEWRPSSGHWCCSPPPECIVWRSIRTSASWITGSRWRHQSDPATIIIIHYVILGLEENSLREIQSEGVPGLHKSLLMMRLRQYWYSTQFNRSLFLYLCISFIHFIWQLLYNFDTKI